MVTTRIELAKYFNELGFKEGAEIGVADGRYSKILCEEIPGLKLHCIDLWKPYEHSWRNEGYQNVAFEKAKKKLTPYNTTLIRKPSIEASFDFDEQSLDFVFIDGSHIFDYVMMDIILWSRRVRKGGIVSGHDYTFFKYCGIVEAVNLYTQIHKCELNITQRNTTEHKDDRQPSWWFIKK